MPALPPTPSGRQLSLTARVWRAGASGQVNPTEGARLNTTLLGNRDTGGDRSLITASRSKRIRSCWLSYPAAADQAEFQLPPRASTPRASHLATLRSAPSATMAFVVRPAGS